MSCRVAQRLGDFSMLNCARVGSSLPSSEKAVQMVRRDAKMVSLPTVFPHKCHRRCCGGKCQHPGRGERLPKTHYSLKPKSEAPIGILREQGRGQELVSMVWNRELELPTLTFTSNRPVGFSHLTIFIPAPPLSCHSLEGLNARFNSSV